MTVVLYNDTLFACATHDDAVDLVCDLALLAEADPDDVTITSERIGS